MRELMALAHLVEETAARLPAIASLPELESLRAAAFHKQGALVQASRALKQQPAADRRALGVQIQQYKQQLEAMFSEATAAWTAADTAPSARQAGVSTGVDVTLPGRRMWSGAPHPLCSLEAEIIASMTPLGFEVVEGPLIEHDWYNFEALNMPPEHPARAMQDSFFVRPDTVLRTHTSSVQIRTMTQRQPPIRVLAPGMVFRRDAVDATHSPAFHQMEGLWVDEQATFADLKGVLQTLTTQLFGTRCAVRFRPSFFPFTEPSCEVDVRCVRCQGAHATCPVCRGSGWLEILGAGMLHPHVLQAVHYDPAKVQGFAFGLGLERMAMLRWEIDDIRLFYDNDVRFLQTLAGLPPAVELPQKAVHASQS